MMRLKVKIGPGRAFLLGLALVGALALPSRTSAQQVPESVARQLQPVCPADYKDGARLLTVQQPTRVTVVCRVTNPLQEKVDYSNTMVFALGPRTTVVGGSAQRGEVAVEGNAIRWRAFELAPGESVTASADLEITPAAADAGQTLVIFTSVTTTAVLASGGFVNIVAPAVTSDQIGGISSGGFVGLPTGAGVTRPAAPPAAAPAPGAAPSLPRTGAGVATDVGPTRFTIAVVLTGVLATVAVLLGALNPPRRLVALRRRRR